MSFASLDEVMPEVERLGDGHETVGRWSLAQICNHLAMSFRGSVEGIPVRAPWLLRKTIAPMVLRRMFQTGQMREGIKIPERFLPMSELDLRTEVESLRAALAEYTSAVGPLADHPFFGRLSAEQWERIHRIHCAHHLSFALPAVLA